MDEQLRIEGAELVGAGRRIPIASIAGAQVVRIEPDNSWPQLLVMTAMILFGVGVHAIFHQREATLPLGAAGIAFVSGIFWARRVEAYYALEVRVAGERVRLGHAADELPLERLAALLTPTPPRARASA